MRMAPWLVVPVVAGSRSVLILIASLVGACDDNPFAGWNERVDAHDKLRSRIVETSGLFEATDPLHTFTRADNVDLQHVSATPGSYVWTPGQSFDATISWDYYSEYQDDRVEAVGYRFASDGWITAGASMGTSQTFHFELPADACMDISAQCLVLPFEQYVVFTTLGQYNNGQNLGRHGMVAGTPDGSLGLPTGRVSIRCGTCSGADCELPPEC